MRQAIPRWLAPLLSLVLLLPAGQAIAATTEPPSVPAAFYGKVTINGQEAPVGTVVVAKIDGEERGRIEIHKTGWYGVNKDDPQDPTNTRLLVKGTRQDENKPITFEVNGVPAITNPSQVMFRPEYIARVDLAATGETPRPPVLQSIEATVDGQDSIPLSVGGTAQIRVTARYTDGSTGDVTDQSAFQSSNTAVATVDSSGLIRAVAAGQAIVSVTFGGQADSVTVIVTAPSPGGGGSGGGGSGGGSGGGGGAGGGSSTRPSQIESTAQVGQPVSLSLENTGSVEIPANAVPAGTRVALEKLPTSSDAYRQTQEAARFASGVEQVVVLQADGLQAADSEFTLRLRADADAGLYYFDPYYRALLPIHAERQGGDLVAHSRWFGTYAVVTERAADFPDVGVQHWAAGHVTELTRKGILAGFHDGRFGPGATLTREQAAKVLVLAAGVRGQAPNRLFPDARGRWSEAFVGGAATAKLLAGYPDGTFGPDRPVTRAELVTMVLRALDLKPQGTPRFGDAAEHWAAGYVSRAVADGIVSGYPDGTFRPDAPVTRAEAAKIIALAFNWTP